mgnify:CR=1 FL=1
MKKILLSALCCAFALLSSCDKSAEKIDDGRSIRLAETRLVLAPTTYAMSVQVSASDAFTVSTISDWIVLKQSNFSAGERAIPIQVEANPSPLERTAQIFFSLTNGSESAVLTVKQNGNEASTLIRPSRMKIEFPFAGGNDTLRVDSDIEFEVETGDEWLTAEQTSYTEGKELVLRFHASVNDTDENRQTFIRLISSRWEESTVITVLQDAFNANMSVSTERLDALSGCDTLQFTVSCDSAFNVVPDVDWITPELPQYEAGQEVEVTLFVEANPEIVERNATITLSLDNGPGTKSVEVVQQARPLAETNELLSFSFEQELNPGLSDNYTMEIDETTVKGRLAKLNDDPKQLVATFSTNGYKVYVGNVEQVSGVTVNDFSKPVTYRVIAENGFSREYTVRVLRFTGLPILYIDTDSGNEITSKSVWVGATYRLEGNLDMNGMAEQHIEIKGRGNSTWSTFLKKRSYNFRLASRQSVLGMPEHKRWVLMANYRDKTLMRNAVSFYISSLCTGLKWTPHYRQVELVLNGTHRGVYQLAEQIKIDPNRVNIAEMSKTDTQGEAITGGYVFELDRGADADQYGWVMEYLAGSSHRANIKIPDKEDGNDQQFAYARKYLDGIDSMARFCTDYTEFYERWFDLPSMIDQLLVYEISGTPEPNGPNSYYMYKDRGNDKLYGGPVWDFDYKSFMPGTSGTWVSKNAIWFSYLMKDPVFVAEFKKRWEELYPKLESVYEFIDNEEAYMLYSAEENWKIHDQNLIDDNRHENGDENIPSAEAIERMRTYLRNKIRWLNNMIARM